MANDEIKKVITVDLGNTSTSLKEYKQHIDDLRGSLLQLDETSEEYQNIAQEITDEQNKLNEVMKVGKGYTDAAEGSYNQLAKTMSELKKQWRATTDETERADLGKQILEINDKLKELDASTGNFQRNVGDYSTAFEKAFDKCLDGIKTLDGPLGELGGNIKDLLPVIKSVNAAAIGGLKGIKAAIAATGIGLLIVGVAELAQHWEDVSKWLLKTTGLTKDYTEVFKNVDDQIKAISEITHKNNTEFEYYLKLMSLNGATEFQVLSKVSEEENKKYEEVKKRREEIEAEYAKYIEAHTYFGETLTFADEDKEWQEKRDKVTEEFITQQNKTVEAAQNALYAWHKAEAEFKKSVEAIANTYKTEEKLENERYEKLMQDAKTYKATAEEIEIIELDHQEKLREIEIKKREETEKTLNEQKKASEEAEKIKEQEIGSILSKVENYGKTELQLLDEQYALEKAALEKYEQSTVALTQMYEDQKLKIIKNNKNEIENTYKSLKQERESLLGQFDIDESENEPTAEQEKEAGVRSLNDAYDEQLQKIQDLIDINIIELENFKGTEEEKQRLIESTSRLEGEKFNLQKQRTDQLNKLEVQRQTLKKKLVQQGVSYELQATSDLFMSISKLGKEGSKFSKTMAIMSTTINTLDAAMAAYKSAANIPYVGWILAPTAAAAAIAAGAVQIKQIKATNEDSSGDINASSSTSSASSASSMLSASMAEVSPLLNEQNDLNRMTTISETGESSKQQNMRVYVVDQDIRDANAHAVSVEENATF